MVMFGFMKPKRIYLDFAAATPTRSEVLAVMRPYFQKNFANPGAIHQEGVLAKQAVERAREEMAKVLGVRPQHVTWTASGTEANNLVIYGHLRYLSEDKGVSFSDMEIISTPIEHPSVTEVLEHLNKGKKWQREVSTLLTHMK